MTEQSSKNFFNNNKKIIMILGIGILAIIIVCSFLKVYVWDQKPKCIDYDVQKRIADDINEKLKEIDLCDCKSDESETKKSFQLSEPEKFGNINFY